jgi:hypothetical protein
MDERENDPPSAGAGWPSRVGAYAWALIVHGLFAVLAVVGLLLLHVPIRDWNADDADTVGLLVVGFFGIVLTAIGLGFFYVAYVGAPRFLGRLERKRERYSHEPWLENRQWRARRVVHSIKYTAWFMWFWCAAWWGILGFLWSVNKELIMADLQGPWSIAIPTTIPFVAGIIGLLVAIGLTWKRWRYGDAVLIIDTLPGWLGEKFRGRVQAGLGSRPQNPVTLTLTCGSMRSERRRGSDGKYTTVWVTDEIWSAGETLHPTQTTFDRGRVTLPIDFDLPPGLPESGHVLDEPQIVWTLEIVPRSGHDQPLKSEFRIPVFARRQRRPDLGPKRSP